MKQRMPGLRGIEHIGFTVPDLEQATRFFVDVLGCEVFYDSGPFKFPDDDWMTRQLNVHPRAEVKKDPVSALRPRLEHRTVRVQVAGSKYRTTEE